MGGERWLRFEDPKAVKSYLRGLEFVKVEVLNDSCWLTWKRWGRLDVGYGFGGFSSEIAGAVCRELAVRFPVRRVGADSTGWWPEREAVSLGYGTWADRIRSFEPFTQGIHGIPDNAPPGPVLDKALADRAARRDLVNGVVRAVFAELDLTTTRG